MDQEKWTTEQIEGYLRHSLSEPERAQLAAELDHNEQLRAEVTAYGQVLDGLDALHEQSLRDQMASWESAAGQSDTTALIAWYLEGKLRPDGEAYVSAQMAENPAFAKEVEAYRPLVEGMEAVQDERFRSQMQDWEAGLDTSPAANSPLKVVSRRPIWLRAAAAVGALLIAFASLYLYARVNYSGSALAQQYHQSPLSERTLGEAAPAAALLKERIDQAHRKLVAQDYNAAFMAFDSLMREIPRAPLDDFNQNLLLEQAGWNRLLAATAMDNPPIDVAAEAQRISQDTSHEYAEKAQQLLADMSTRWFQWAN